ncbi:MAG: hypothetical protein IIB00_08085 [candidate division Zixibacteria bacterium]|nr:hypothetical protein [candidate division Zixibacteria bacterium]
MHSANAKPKTIGPSGCGIGQAACHATENGWWKNDVHKGTALAMYDDLAFYEQIAEKAGVGAENLFKGSHSCMKCHGTVISGSENEDIDEGVSCESCHGPGSDYLGRHSQGDFMQGVNRAEYRQSLTLGLLELKNTDVRGEMCVSCHYMTDQKLLAAGHPGGQNFRYVKGMRQISKHWKHGMGDEDTDKTPFAKAKKKRGPIAFIAKTNASVSTPTPAAPARRFVAPPQAASDPFFSTKSIGPLDLPPFPTISDSASVEEIMLILKRRLDLIYKRIAAKK